MDPFVTETLNLVFRWVHVIAGVTWIGLLYFFNWINGHVVAALDADTKKKVIPELLPRTLYWFRWGAAFTWVSGFLLLGIVYYMGGTMVDQGSALSAGAATGIGIGLLVVGWAVYDFLWKFMADKEVPAAVISFVLVTAVAIGLGQLFSGRAMFIHVGALFGTLMAANVWMRIWPNQRKIIKATVDGTAADGAWGAMAKLRSKHNTYMSVPLILFMVSNHFPSFYGDAKNGIYAAIFVALGWGIAKFCYIKSGSAAAKFY